MKILTNTWENVNLLEIARLTYAARPAKVQQDSLTVEAIVERLHGFLSTEPAKIITLKVEGELLGLAILYIRNSKVLELNPGQLLAGYPVVAPGEDVKRITGILLDAATTLARQEGYSKIECIQSTEGGEPAARDEYAAHGFLESECYVEMLGLLPAQAIQKPSLPVGFDLKPLHQAAKSDLFHCYYAAFNAGDARFFFDQDEQERQEYFELLGYTEALNEPASVTLWQGQNLIGFALVLPYGEGNCHISCMCVAAEFRRKGLGEFLLHTILHTATQQGYQTVTLGTETGMVAYELYQKNGFRVTGGSVIRRWRAAPCN